MDHQFPLPTYTGRRDGSPAHVRAIVDSIYDRQSTEHTSHIDAYVDHMAYLEFLDEEADAAERREEEEREEQRVLDRRQYLRSIGCNPDSPWA